MSTRRFVHESRLPVDAATVFAWHARPGALERLLPPWESVRVESARGGISPGAEVTLRLKVGPFPVRWVAEHTDLVEGASFADVQRKGPFARWTQTAPPSGRSATGWCTTRTCWQAWRSRR